MRGDWRLEVPAYYPMLWARMLSAKGCSSLLVSGGGGGGGGAAAGGGGAAAGGDAGGVAAEEKKEEKVNTHTDQIRFLNR